MKTSMIKTLATTLFLATATASAWAESTPEILQWKQQWEQETASSIALTGRSALQDISDNLLIDMKNRQVSAVSHIRSELAAGQSSPEAGGIALNLGGGMDLHEPAAQAAVSP